MALDTLFARERDALAGLADLAKSRALREAGIADAFRAGTEGADVEVNRVRKKLAVELAPVLP